MDATAPWAAPPSTAPSSTERGRHALLPRAELSEDALSAARELFALLAPEGQLPAKELHLALDALGMAHSVDDLTIVLLDADPESRGWLDEPAFLRALSHKFPEDEAAVLREAWARLDASGTGVISAAEFRYMMQTVEKMSDEEADALLKRAWPLPRALPIFSTAMASSRAIPSPDCCRAHLSCLSPSWAPGALARSTSRCSLHSARKPSSTGSGSPARRWS